jgi:hypothetical protein
MENEFVIFLLYSYLSETSITEEEFTKHIVHHALRIVNRITH